MVEISKFPRGVPGRDLRNNIAPYAVWADPNWIGTHPFWKYEPGKILVGAVGPNFVGVTDDRHMMTVAGSRAGKGVSVIIPNLIEYPGSVIVIDPKGENAHHTALRRGKMSAYSDATLGQAVYVLDPFGVSGLPTDSFNPLSMIDAKSDTAVDDAALVAEALVLSEAGPSRHFSSAARNFLRGLILQVCTDAKPERRNLLRVRELLTYDTTGFDLLLSAMKTNPACNGVIRRAANSLSGKAPNERSGVISTAIEQTDFLDSPPLARVLAKSDFSLADCPQGVWLPIAGGFASSSTSPLKRWSESRRSQSIPCCSSWTNSPFWITSPALRKLLAKLQGFPLNYGPSYKTFRS
jgi:type IV secretion system protein VirD4